MLSVAGFKSIKSRKPEQVWCSWGKLAERLGTFSNHRKDKLRCPGWSPVRYKTEGEWAKSSKGSYRLAVNIAYVYALVLDHDDGRTIHEELERWEGYTLALHTSWSHQAELHKFRVVLPFAEPVLGEQWSMVYRWAAEHLDGGKADPKCSDPCRLFFLPAVGSGGPHYTRVNTGRLLDLTGMVDRLEQEQRQARAQQGRERAERIRRLRRQARSTREADRMARQLLDIDPAARERVGAAMGGTTGNGGSAGQVVRNVTCPACGRPSVWWALLPRTFGGAACDHRNTCGWAGSLWNLARERMAT